MQEIIFKDHSFVITDCHEYNLFIQVSADGFSILVQHPVNQDILLYELYPFNYAGHHLLFRKIRDFITGNEIFMQSFAKTTVLFTDRNFTLIPEVFLSEKLVHHLLPFKGKYQEEPETILIPIQQMNATLVFAVEKVLFEYLSDNFPSAEISHEVYPLLQNLTSYKTAVLNFHLHSSWFIATGIGEKGVNFLNTFDFSNEADLIYFMLSVIKEPTLVFLPVRISGKIESNDSRYSIIKKYIPGAELSGYPEVRMSAPGNIPFYWLHGIISL